MIMCVSPVYVQTLVLNIGKGHVTFLPSVMDDDTESEPVIGNRLLVVKMKLGCKVSPCFHAMSPI